MSLGFGYVFYFTIHFVVQRVFYCLSISNHSQLLRYAMLKLLYTMVKVLFFVLFGIKKMVDSDINLNFIES